MLRNFKTVYTCHCHSHITTLLPLPGDTVIVSVVHSTAAFMVNLLPATSQVYVMVVSLPYSTFTRRLSSSYVYFFVVFAKAMADNATISKIPDTTINTFNLHGIFIGLRLCHKALFFCAESAFILVG